MIGVSAALSAAVSAALSVCLAAPSQPPVSADSAKVIDWFRRPDCSWCSGNRGVEFALAPGTPVVASLPGRVAFVGPVGGLPYVVVRTDPDAVRPSVSEGLYAVYGGVGDPEVSKGGRVAIGQMLGRSRGYLYVGVRLGPRRDGRYLDPAPLLGMVRNRARLVVREPLGTSLRQRPRPWEGPRNTHHQCSVLPPVVASAREPGP
jgi:murein DD-endopeptidase MepM/ murein hydrolase activator NlpD